MNRKRFAEVEVEKNEQHKPHKVVINLDNEDYPQFVDLPEVFDMHTQIVEEHIEHVDLGPEIFHDGLLYSRLLKRLRTLDPKVSRIALHLANLGGDCENGFRLFAAFKNCGKPVDVTVEGATASMGAILALCGRSLKMWEGSYLMYHNYSNYTGGKGGELTTGVSHWHKHWKRVSLKWLVPFLTLKEVNGLFKDQDVYISWDDDGTRGTTDIKDRIYRHFYVCGASR